MNSIVLKLSLRMSELRRPHMAVKIYPSQSTQCLRPFVQGWIQMPAAVWRSRCIKEPCGSDDGVMFGHRMFLDVHADPPRGFLTKRTSNVVRHPRPSLASFFLVWYTGTPSPCSMVYDEPLTSTVGSPASLRMRSAGEWARATHIRGNTMPRSQGYFGDRKYRYACRGPWWFRVHTPCPPNAWVVTNDQSTNDGIIHLDKSVSARSIHVAWLVERSCSCCSCCCCC